MRCFDPIQSNEFPIDISQCVYREKITWRLFRFDFWDKYIDRVDSTISIDIYYKYNVQLAVANPISNLFVFIFYSGANLWSGWSYKHFQTNKKIASAKMISLVLHCDF